MVFSDADDLGLVAGVGNNQIITAVGKAQVKAAVGFGKRTYRRILAEDRGADKGLPSFIENDAVDRKCFVLGKNSEGKDEQEE
jgi:hypothetical protein